MQVLLSVDWIAYDGGADVSEVNPDLMGAACLRPCEDQAGCFVEGGDLDFSDRFPSVGENGHLFSMDGVAADRHVDGCIGGAPLADGQIKFFHFAGGEEFDEFLVGRNRFGGDKDPCGVFI